MSAARRTPAPAPRSPVAPRTRGEAPDTYAPVQLILREPPSANRWWRVVNGRMVTSAAAREYKEHVANAALLSRAQTIPRHVDVLVEVTWWRGRRAGDLDKRLGVLLDALQGCVYESDAQVARITAQRYDQLHAGKVVVWVRPLLPHHHAATRVPGRAPDACRTVTPTRVK